MAGTDESLFSIGATANVVVAVGGNVTNGRIYERVGTAWSNKTINPSDPPWRGVAASEGGVFAVGQEGHVAERTSDGWVPEIPPGVVDSFHAAWVDPQGDVWAVGGKFDRIPPIDGIISRKGTTMVAPVGM